MNKSQDATRFEEFKNILEHGEAKDYNALFAKIGTKLDNPYILEQFISGGGGDWRAVTINYAHAAGLIDKSEKEELKKWVEENPLSEEG